MPPSEAGLQKKDFDYIITGTGCAGLSLLMHLLQSGKFTDKKILLVDKQLKNENDRTWCFWETNAGLFEPIVHKHWQQLWFHAPTFSKKLNVAPYQYKLIRGIDFYNYCFKEIRNYPNVTFKQTSVDNIFSNTSETGIIAGGEKICSEYVFNSILFEKPVLKKNEYYLLQHFKGWLITTPDEVFDPSIATLMDFKTDQSAGATFFYVLPFSPTQALIEYTLFSGKLLQDADYEKALKNYVENDLHIKSYSVNEKEFGIIPMTNYAFPATQNNIIHIGTAGGQTKASSGYTFRAIQKQSAALVKSLLQTGTPFSFKRTNRRFHFYDSILLHILHYNILPGDTIFTDLFQKNKPKDVLEFLDNETSLMQEINIISSLPAAPFLKAALHHIF